MYKKNIIIHLEFYWQIRVFYNNNISSSLMQYDYYAYILNKGKKS